MAGDPKKSIKKRILLIQVLLIISIFMIGAKSLEIQIFQAENLAEKAKNEYSKSLTIKGERGHILDRNMSKLATSVDVLSVAANPMQVENPADASGKLASILNIDRKILKKKLSGKKMFVWVQRKISPDQADRIKKLDIQGVFFRNDVKRFYPNRDLAAQIIGFTGADDSGLEGLEFKYNSLLEGEILKIKVKKDGIGRILDLEKKHRAELKGNSIVLTIDKKIQFISERVLENTVKKHRAESGMALVMKPNTGELLAMAHYPGFNLNNFKEYEKKLFRNRSVTDAFEPGSTIKIFTAAAAIEKGFTPESVFDCENGKYRIGSFTIHDTHPHGLLSMSQIIKYSSNIGAVKLSEEIGNKNLHDYFAAFGLGTRTGTEFPGETAGILMPFSRWSKIDAGAIAFGQGISVSGIQLISGISAIANSGNLMKVMLIKKIISNTREDLQVFLPERIRKVISSKTAAQVKKMMNKVVEEKGTGTKAAIEGYSVCGKTGTAQKAMKNGKGYEKNKYISIFGGFAPEKNSELAVLVIIDEPKMKYYGGDVAAPAFKAIMAESMNYLNIPPDKSAAEGI